MAKPKKLPISNRLLENTINLRNCTLGFECKQDWYRLLETNEELMNAIKFNHCVAIKVRHDEIPQTKRPDITVGMLTPANYDEPAYLRNKK